MRRPSLPLYILFMGPALLLYGIVFAYPVTQVLFRSFFDWDGLNEPEYVGWDNYRFMLQDPVFWTSLRNGAIFAGLITLYQVGLATIAALVAADAKFRGARILRSAFFIPVVLSTTVVAQLWLSIYNARYGLINASFESLGMPYRQNWLEDPGTAIYALAATNAWQFMGFHLVLIYAGVKSIPSHYYEAALMEGAGRWRAHRDITLPLLWETFRFSLIIALTGGLRSFTEALVMTRGGPGTATYTLTYMMYTSAFRSGDYGYALAPAVVLIVQCLIVMYAINAVFDRRRIEY